MADRYDLDRERERANREEWDRGREPHREFGNERWGDRRREDYERERRGPQQSGYEGRENRPYCEYTSDFGERGDWGRQGNWGTFGNRPEYGRENWRDERRYETGRQENRGEGHWRPNEPEPSQYGRGERNQWNRGGGYSGGTSSFSGGMGSYGERGRYTGRGPKGYQRSDDRIREDINERLTDHPDIDASDIEVRVASGEVTLTGTVEHRHAKRLAEDVVEGVSGVREVHNQVRVQQPASVLPGQHYHRTAGP